MGRLQPGFWEGPNPHPLVSQRWSQSCEAAPGSQPDGEMSPEEENMEEMKGMRWDVQ